MKVVQSAPAKPRPSQLWDGDRAVLKDKKSRFHIFERRGEQLWTASDYDYKDIDMGKAQQIADAAADKLAATMQDAWVLNQQNRLKYQKMAADVEELSRKLAPQYGRTPYEKGSGLYLWDEGVDRDNVTDSGVDEYNPEYWGRMIGSGGLAAGERAGEYGIDINDALGYNIY